MRLGLLGISACTGGGDVAATPVHTSVLPNEPQGQLDPPARPHPGPCIEIRDNGADGRAEVLTRYAYDEQGRRVLMEHDTFDDGFFDYRQTWQISKDGLHVVEEIDSHGNGIIDVRTTMDYADSGEVILWSRDSNGDGTIDHTRRHAYDGGWLSEIIETQPDNPTRRTTFERDSDGNVVLESLYTNDALRRTVTRHFEGGELLHVAIDQDADGSADEITDFERLADRVQTLYDIDADGAYDWFADEWFDAQARTIRKAADTNADGLIEWAEEFVYAGERLAQRRFDDDGDGAADRTIRYEYNERGQETVVELDREMDGTVDARDRFFYDSAGNRLAVSRDTDGDGTVDVRYQYQYGCF